MTKTTKKAAALDAWRELTPGQAILPHMTPIPYKAEGSRYGACGIRIDGNPAFIDAVLSRLKDLCDGENQFTRLELARSDVKDTTINGVTRQFNNAAEAAQVCYVRLHKRGDEGGRAMAISRERVDETRRYALAIGIDPDA